ncbi:THO complex subunit 1 transcription elongation factor-domain-containing protein [Emericellopsis atlantica]|uniref:THO complex subunit 1 transcription elongation factor-domain-containing protein n=1 Tax=Emericellopsis atlantica TaxID=2614577 RepID=A0A9P7ZN40_9HYPO|nr:THO complex subunit 1 transcription elongation factor-domain-containing protein [Emericellopsis atlantica]KAG9255173.1 THO complex subunit 1 transcription elongation factor-domain-containing protein [Emericellopsis atlantica]
MPSIDVANTTSPGVIAFRTFLDEVLGEATTVKPPSDDRSLSINPPLQKDDLHNFSERLSEVLSDYTAAEQQADDADKTAAKARKHNVVEVAARAKFAALTASTPISSPEAVNIWNLLDIIFFTADIGHGDPALMFLLVEDLLSSQTISGCRIIFDFLESRRERCVSKFYKQSHLIVLRSCNELLRRLSRAEDTAFCGRVFVFLFQYFPLGDKSSVNLRGQYHVENVTTYEKPLEGGDTMEVDKEENLDKAAEAPQTEKPGGKKADAGTPKTSSPPLSNDELYDLFWPLQESFSQPLRLFEPANLKPFQRGVEETVKKFVALPSATSRSSTVDEPKSSLKRKREGLEDGEGAEAYNPRYLTSRDLFELEIGDLTFRRHILVQMLILLNFILSWTKEPKAKYDKMIQPWIEAAKERTVVDGPKVNHSLLYTKEFSEEDARWARETKDKIAEYMRKDVPGKAFYRVIETVLARDKNWVYWKMASCPPIKRDPIDPKVWAEAQASALRVTTSKRLRPVPMNAVPMEFLKPKAPGQALKELEDPKRYRLPDLDSFKAKINDSDFDIQMAKTPAEKARAQERKASQSWRAMRIARGFKLAAFDKIDNPDDISAIFEPLEDAVAEVAADEIAADEDMPTNREAVIVSGPPGAGKSVIIQKLMEARKGVFERVVRHTTREPKDGETDGKDFHFVKAPEFNQLRDGDRLIENVDQGDIAYGTSYKAVEAVTESGKVPIIEMDIDSAKFAKDMDFDARYILVKPASPESHETFLKAAGGRDDAAIKAVIDGLPALVEGLNADNIAGKVILNENVENASQELGDYLYHKDADADTEIVNRTDTGEAPVSEQNNGGMDVDAPEAS